MTLLLNTDFAAVGRMKMARPTTAYAMSGKLYLSSSGFLLLSVPNAFVRGAFDSLHEPGIELPPAGPSGQLDAHITVMRPEEIEQFGGPDKITERGQIYHYQLGKLKTVEPNGWKAMSKAWLLEVKSPELKSLRRSYGLSALPNDNKYEFHITVAVRRRNVLRENEVSKTSADSKHVNAISRVLQDARDATDTNPTEAQIEAGNYKKGKVTLHGLAISLENPKGSTRSGTAKDGKKWSVKMKYDYGYFLGTVGKDKDHVDVFIGPRTDSEIVFIINQSDPANKHAFDEHKCVLGAVSESEAREVYLANYEKGWQGLKSICSLTIPQFKWWLEHGNQNKEITDGQFAKRSSVQNGPGSEQVNEYVETNEHPGSGRETDAVYTSNKEGVHAGVLRLRDNRDSDGDREGSGDDKLKADFKAKADASISGRPTVRFVLPFGNRYLMQQAGSKRFQGMIRHAGGGIDGEETPEQAALREYKEEFGRQLNPSQLRYLGLDPRPEFSSHHFYEIADHDLAPGSYQASNDPDEIVNMIESEQAGDNYLGPDMSKFGADKTVALVVERLRRILAGTSHAGLSS